MESRLKLAEDALVLTEGRISNRAFRFERVDGSVITEKLILAADGTIALFSNENESRWSLSGAALLFSDVRGEITTRFETLHSVDPLIISGPFLPTDATAPWHKLIEIVPRADCALPVPSPAAHRAQPRADVAVLLRSHVADDKFHDLHRVLATTVDGDFDLYPVMDETAGRPEVALDNVVWHSEQACPELGLTQQHPHLLWQCGDFPFYFALRDLPPYEYYIMMEYDIEMTQGDAGFLLRLIDRLPRKEEGGVDLVALGLGPANPSWAWRRACNLIYPDPHFMYYPFVILSRRAVSYMHAQRQLEAVRRPSCEDVIHCEAFTSTCLRAAGFKCLDLNTLVPGAYTLPLMSIPDGTYMGQELAVDPTIQMIHPVYTPQAFLVRLLSELRSGRKSRDQYLEVLRSEKCSRIERPLLDEFVALAN